MSITSTTGMVVIIIICLDTCFNYIKWISDRLFYIVIIVIIILWKKKGESTGGVRTSKESSRGQKDRDREVVGIC